jgi:hypothetical protein
MSTIRLIWPLVSVIDDGESDLGEKVSDPFFVSFFIKKERHSTWYQSCVPFLSLQM